MEIDLPEVVAEVRAAFERYEQALVSNDVATLDAMFRHDSAHHPLRRRREPLRLRGGRGLPRGALAHQPDAHPLAHGHHHLRPRLRRRLDPVPSRRAPAKVGRQMQTWVRFAEGWRVVAAHVSIIDDPARR